MIANSNMSFVTFSVTFPRRSLFEITHCIGDGVEPFSMSRSCRSGPSVLVLVCGTLVMNQIYYIIIMKHDNCLYQRLLFD